MAVCSNPLPLGTRLPWFRLTDLEGASRTTSDIASGQVAVIAFICNHSPYVIHIEDRLAEVLNEYQAKGIYVITIAPNDAVSYPSDGLDEMRQQAARGVSFEFPYCLDETQEVAKAFQAVCTPEFFVYDQSGRLSYHGQFDSSRPNVSDEAGATGQSLIDGIEAAITGDSGIVAQPPSLGCSVKWRSGCEPDYVLAIPARRWIVDLA